MEVETLRVARSLGWKVHVRCTDGYREGTRSIVYRKQLDLETLVCTRAEPPAFAVRILAHFREPLNGASLCSMEEDRRW
jgi:hypothetical protein